METSVPVHHDRSPSVRLIACLLFTVDDDQAHTRGAAQDRPGIGKGLAHEGSAASAPAKPGVDSLRPRELPPHVPCLTPCS